MPRKIAVNPGIAALLLLTLALGGCSLPGSIVMPVAEIAAVRCVERGPAANRYQILLTITNPNDVALPITSADYTLTIADKKYQGDTPPSATLPAAGTITVSLPAAVPATGNEFTVKGHLEVHPPGQIKQILYDLGVPMPKLRFENKGVIEDVKPETAKPEVSGQKSEVSGKK